MKNMFSIQLMAILVSIIVCHTNLNSQASTEQEIIYIQLEIKGLACPYCAFGMEKELKKVSGVEQVEIELKKGLAYISTPKSQQPTKESLEQIIEDAGFTAGKIDFSDKPFDRIKKEKEKK